MGKNRYSVNFKGCNQLLPCIIIILSQQHAKEWWPWLLLFVYRPLNLFAEWIINFSFLRRPAW
jgi:hypothetical protein